jgi:hypothetical protein
MRVRIVIVVIKTSDGVAVIVLIASGPARFSGSGAFPFSPVK